MDWMPHNHSRSLSSRLDLARASNSPSKLTTSSPMISKNVLAHANEFVPRVISSSASASPNFLSSYSSVTTSPALHPLAKKLEDGDLSSHVTPESTSPPLTNSSPILHEKLGNSPSLPAYQENVGGTTYFYQYQTTAENCQPADTAVNTSLPAEYNVYTGKQEPSFFLSEDLRNDILNRNVLTLLQPDPQQYPDLPQEVDSYHELFPLEPLSNNTLHKAHMGYQASMYKATHIKTGTHFCLRRIHGFRLSNTKCMAFVELWKKLSHSNIVQLKEVFTTKAFGDNSMIFVYDYHPASETLLNKHFSPDQPGYCDPFINDTSTPRPYSYQKNNLLRHTQNNKLPEPLIWNYIIQLTSALRIIHSSALACRSLDPTKIIINSRNR
ncbi:hypothetical protein NQ314_011490 [Rhamnusium bicolor]|uniref:Protein kinase domain-containing protein n=1 Tax=Rhamnusium bicolor TaxID=1586634 RepID=A0AAV8XJ37_9CUCU|nr:hypothetical protein NQ314_011490 [Rhamnusium bicolor]